MSAQVETFQSRDGASIACHVRGEGPPLVLVHGTSADHTRWTMPGQQHVAMTTAPDVFLSAVLDFLE